MSPYRRQSDPAWSANLLGTGSLTWGRAACMWFCLLEALERLTGAVIDPEVLHARVVAHEGFAGSSLILPRAAAVLGLNALEKDRVRYGDAAACLERIDQTFAARRLALLHVDHDRTLETGDAGGDHFILAIGPNPAPGRAGWACVDPAVGELTVIQRANPPLEGPAGWGRQRSFKVVGVAPIGLPAL